MPPKKSQRKAVAKQDPCCVCLQKFNQKDEILFCAGRCQKFLHRYCASVSEQAYKEFSAEDAEPFLCYCCFRSKKEEQIESLLTTVEALKVEIQSLKAASNYNAASSSTNYSDAVRGDRRVTTSSSTDPRKAPRNTPQRPIHGEIPLSDALSSPDKKYNVVVYGVEECPPGMSKTARFESDLSNVVKVLSSINSSIEPTSVKDCHRLGKFTPSRSRPRPLLVKFIRISDVTSTFSKRGNLSRPYVIKLDMTREQREIESALMKERWRLIESGVHRSNIKIKDNRLFVGKKLHGSVVDKTFQHVQIEQREQLKQHKYCDNDSSVVPTEPCGIVESNEDSPCPSAEAVVQGLSPPCSNTLHTSDVTSPTTPSSVTPPKFNSS